MSVSKGFKTIRSEEIAKVVRLIVKKNLKLNCTMSFVAILIVRPRNEYTRI